MNIKNLIAKYSLLPPALFCFLMTWALFVKAPHLAIVYFLGGLVYLYFNVKYLHDSSRRSGGKD